MQLLVSDTDVKSYKQIKDDLDGLRLLVEKSELWVFKPKGNEDKSTSAATNGIKKEDEHDVLSKVIPGACGNSVGGPLGSGSSLNHWMGQNDTVFDPTGSPIDLDLGPILDQQQARNYKTIQQVRMNDIKIKGIAKVSLKIF